MVNEHLSPALSPFGPSPLPNAEREKLLPRLVEIWIGWPIQGFKV